MPPAPKSGTHIACDRCHGMKEKCVYTNNTPLNPSCFRCTKLGRVCTISRRQRHSGRPRKTDTTPVHPRTCQEFVWDGSQAHHSKSLDTSAILTKPSNRLLANRTSLEVVLLGAMFDNKNFIHRFILGPSFAETELSRLFASLSSFPDLLLSICLACSGRFSLLLNSSGLRTHSIESDYSNSARAVKALRKIGASRGNTTRGSGDLILALVLGLGVVTFDLLDSGLHAHSICRYTISLLSNTTDTVPELNTGLLPLVFMDTCNCLVRRQVPVYKLPLANSGTVDRYIGLCVPLLSRLYDICHISREMEGRDIYLETGKALGARIQAAEDEVRSWSPSLGSENTHGARLAPEEVRAIFKQAEVFKSATLLILHRLQPPFEAQDDLAVHMAGSIIEEIRGFYPGHEPGNNNIQQRTNAAAFEYRLSLPFLVAAVELRDPNQRLQALETLGYVVCARMYPRVCELLRQFVIFVWWARDSGWGGHWFDLTLHGPQFVLF